MADLVSWMAFVVAIGSYFFTGRLYSAARRQAEAMEKQLEMLGAAAAPRLALGRPSVEIRWGVRHARRPSQSEPEKWVIAVEGAQLGGEPVSFDLADVACQVGDFAVPPGRVGVEKGEETRLRDGTVFLEPGATCVVRVAVAVSETPYRTPAEVAAAAKIRIQTDRGPAESLAMPPAEPRQPTG